jgi:hypothetical protein
MSQKKKLPQGNRRFAKPVWLGREPLSGKSIFVHAEQGLGDVIQFSRYIACLNELGAKVLFAPRANLKALMQGLDGVHEIVDEDNEKLEFDYHVPLLSLPLAFQTDLPTIPAKISYLGVAQDRVALWRQRLGDHGFKIGICWQGSKNKIDAGRSFPVSKFHALAQTANVRLISLHKGEGEAQLADLPPDMRVESLGDDFDAGADAFLDTAAVMKCCDLVITSDTSIAHLAGALGVKTWLALQYVPDWRWLLDRDDSPWYPTMRLFRQKTPGDWDGVFAQMAKSLPE